MAARTLETTVTFAHPFRITALDETLPAGSYRLVSDEEEILGLSFLAFRRTATSLHLPAIADTTADQRVVAVDPAELEVLLAADARPA